MSRSPLRTSHPISVVGLVGESFGHEARIALGSATVVVGSKRQLALTAALQQGTAEQIELRGPLPALFDTIARRADDGQDVCVLASGDPGFFGIVGALSEHFGRRRLVVHPAPSSVALAFARLGLPWDDATVVSAHGRPLPDALARMAGPKVAVLTSPDNPPEAIGRALAARGDAAREVFVLSHLGETRRGRRPDRRRWSGPRPLRSPVGGRALGSRPAGPRGSAVVGAARVCVQPPQRHDHQGRSARRSRWASLRSPSPGCCGTSAPGQVRSRWNAPACDLRSGSSRSSGTRRMPPESAPMRNDTAWSSRWSAATRPNRCWTCPIPTGSSWAAAELDVLDAALPRLRSGGVVVATYALMERAGEAQKRLGNLVQVSVAHGVPTGGLGTRLSAENPVFVCWGPESTGRPHVVRQRRRPSRIAEVIAPADSSVSGRYRAPMVSASCAAKPKAGVAVFDVEHQGGEGPLADGGRRPQGGLERVVPFGGPRGPSVRDEDEKRLMRSRCVLRQVERGTADRPPAASVLRWPGRPGGPARSPCFRSAAGRHRRLRRRR